MVLLVETDKDEAMTAAKRLLLAIDALDVNGVDKKIKTTASIGVSLMSENDLSFEDVMNRADKAMYQAKDKGRNRVELV